MTPRVGKSGTCALALHGEQIRAGTPARESPYIRDKNNGCTATEQVVNEPQSGVLVYNSWCPCNDNIIYSKSTTQYSSTVPAPERVPNIDSERRLSSTRLDKYRYDSGGPHTPMMTTNRILGVSLRDTTRPLRGVAIFTRHFC